jgi:fucose permease
VIPGFFAGIFARMKLPPLGLAPPPTLAVAMQGFRSPSAVLFSLLLFFQFGNEWSVAGWLPLFLIQRLGMSPANSLLLLFLYWLALLVGRVAAQALLPKVSHTKLLMSSVLSAFLGCIVLSSTNNVFGAVSGILFVGGGFASIYPLVVERIGGKFPYYHPGFFDGIFLFAFTGGLLAPASIGYAAEVWGIKIAMVLPLLGSMMVFLLIVAIWLHAKVAAMLKLKEAAE